MAQTQNSPRPHKRSICSLLLFLCLVAAQSLPAPAQGTEQPKPSGPLRVSTRLITPFVLKEKGELTGFSIDLWHGIAAQLGVQSEFSVQTALTDLLAEVKSRKADVGIAAISITAQREKEYDFSQPMFESGLQILVPTQTASSVIMPGIISFFYSRSFLELVGVLLLLVLIPSHVIWLVERRHDEGIISKSYYPGIFKATWWAAGTLGGQMDEMPKSPIGRMMALFWMFVSVLFIAYFTATVTTSLTVQQLRGEINGPDDLPGKIVATIAGSTSATYLHEKNIETLEFNQIDDAYRALSDRRANAVVYDAPILLFYSSHDGKGKVAMAGPIFRKENYAIIFPENSPYRKSVDQALLLMKENGTYEALYQKWFGEK
jgi:polar amino acid transport system substrate-binding protein